MSKIKTILNLLSDEERKSLEEAFDKCEPYYVRFHYLDPGEANYIGVNIEKIPILKEEEKVNEWSLGRIVDD